ncbi:MAG: hypothetical protein J6Y03_00620 [Alphaproteobacteria bacterium]|nr:hypothetical protein [Alphaproteobacteria bacterium]
MVKKERCPDYCPFLKKDEVFCQLFDKKLIYDEFIVKCEECMNADVRKSQYKKKIKDFEKRQKLWDKAIKNHPNKLFLQIKNTFRDLIDRKAIKDFISSIAKEFPILLDKKTSQMLMNLFLTLGGSEKMQMKELLTNSKSAEVLIKFIQTKGSQKDILKLVCQKMDQMTIEQQKIDEVMHERMRQERQKTRLLER